MLTHTILVYCLLGCVLGSKLPVHRLAHTGPARGFALSRGRIFGGHDATRGEFPYLVTLQHVLSDIRYDNCGGSILSSNAILTAGHCAVQLGYYIAVAGEYDLNSVEGSEQEVKVSDQIVHPDYEGDVAPNDVAVFILESPLTLGTYVQPISLPSAGSIPEGGSTAVVSGWGITETTDTPNILQTVDVSIIDYETCSKYIDDLDFGYNPLTDTMICTGPIYDGISVCSGDSGGPLTQGSELIGVVSWGILPCGSDGAPSVYTRVSAHLDFINQNLEGALHVYK